MTKLVIAIARGVFLDLDVRRKAMFVIVLTALVLLFGGATFLNGWLSARPVFFILFWAGVAWLTLTAFLLAIYDMLVLRIAARKERRRLKHRVFGRNDEPPDV